MTLRLLHWNMIGLLFLWHSDHESVSCLRYMENFCNLGVTEDAWHLSGKIYPSVETYVQISAHVTVTVLIYQGRVDVGAHLASHVTPLLTCKYSNRHHHHADLLDTSSEGTLQEKAAISPRAEEQIYVSLCDFSPFIVIKEVTIQSSRNRVDFNFVQILFVGI